MHCPNSITILPDPVLSDGSEKPVNSNVWAVARDEMLISEEKDFALDVELIDKDAAVLALEQDNESCS